MEDISGQDVIRGGGNDTILGSEGNDTVYVSEDSDR